MARKQDLKEGFGDLFRFAGKLVLCFLVLAAVVVTPHIFWPERDVTMLSVRTTASDGRLTLVHFELLNGPYMNLKDPKIACDMNGASGTTIKTVSKVLYVALPEGKLHSFDLIDMGEIPEQATQFRCYVKSVSIASIRWR